MWRMLVLFGLLIVCTCYAPRDVEAKEPFEEMHLKMGYTTVDDAVAACEKYFSRDIKLPIEVPPVVFTHQLGRCSTTFGSPANDELEIEYLNERDTVYHYMIRIRPSEYRGNLFQNKNDLLGTYELRDGTKAQYGKVSSGRFYMLTFEKNNYQYALIVGYRVKAKITEQVLVDIANSVRGTYPDPKENPLR
ncbi:hypothetical protein [Paenibacillus qinlingensis]|uniref:Lipoprotein n=1 Tax=Paenibacillus qinlingensis TaxID=1837343 RepID=A0ABU1NRL9_9BACL|nr:hypothetical protein [Paenibacillus qinlingensis]MDR6550126.1 hypothetical protein [Paenibacillus qinlingensis]